MTLRIAPPARDHADQGAETPYNDGETLRNGDIAALLAAARELLAASDRLDGQLAARLAAHAEGYRRGLAEAERARAEGYVEAIADIKAAQHGIVDVLRRSVPAASQWRVCCLPCRRAGCRAGCRDCQDRTRETFADPLPGDYLGGPVAWLPGWVPGSGAAPALKAAS